VPPQPVGPLATAPDDLDYRHEGSRVHVAAHQRGADATAVGRLIMYVPSFAASLAVVATLCVGIFGTTLGWLIVAAWLASGALVFHRPTELFFARRFLKLRAPLPEEQARLEPVWREVTARAGIEAHTYELMVEASDDLNAVAAAGHVVGVTTYALNEIPSSNLAAVLAHELGHHTGGHSWAGLLGYWYSVPGRIAWSVASFLAIIAVYLASRISMAVATVLFLFLAVFALAYFLAWWPITLSLLVAPYFLAYTARKGELRADEQAVALGFAREMAEVLHHLQLQEEAARAHAAKTGEKLEEPGALGRLLSSHPGNQRRLRALEPYLQPGR
jgi:Zn-dependent protease with chaperone function